MAYFAHCHYLVFIEDVSGKTGPQRWRPLSSNGKLIDEKALIGHGKKAVKVNMLPQAPLRSFFHMWSFKLRPSENFLVDFCTSALCIGKLLKSIFFTPKKQMIKLVEGLKHKSPIENFHLLPTCAFFSKL